MLPVLATGVISRKILLLGARERGWRVTHPRACRARKSVSLLSLLVPIIRQQLSETRPQITSLLACQGTFRRTVLDPEAAAVLLGFGVRESVDARDFFRQVISHVTKPRTKVILTESVGLPRETSS